MFFEVIIVKKFILGVITIGTAVSLVACGGNDTPHEEHVNTEPEVEVENDTDLEEAPEHGHDHAHMDHSSSGEVPENLKEAENPTYPVETVAIIEDGHMSGMEGAEATIVGAYHTIVYAVSYTPTDGGPREMNHKWVIHEELVDVGEAPLEVGDEVVLDADHMRGMMGAIAEIDSVIHTTVYMVDFTLITGGDLIKNHKWVIEEELGPHTHH